MSKDILEIVNHYQATLSFLCKRKSYQSVYQNTPIFSWLIIDWVNKIIQVGCASKRTRATVPDL